MVSVASLNYDCNNGPAPLPEREMTALFARGFHLMPCGGDDGKKPLRKGWNTPTRKRMPFDVVMEVMRRNNSSTYGVRLDGHVVVDCDTWDDETEKLVAERFPETPYKVRTSRGMHLYYRAGDPVPRNIKRAGIQIDFKAGPSHFVVGPGSVRPDGKAYVPNIPDLALLPELPRFRDADGRGSTAAKTRTDAERSDHGPSNDEPPAASFRDGMRIPRGKRNPWLTKKAAELAGSAASLEDLFQQLKVLAGAWFVTLDDFLDSEVRSIADWAWQLRLENRLWRGRHSEFGVSRLAMDRLNTLRSRAANATVLYLLLLAEHGHRPGKAFPIAVAAMCKAGLLPYGKSTAHNAKQALIEVGLIKPVYRGGFKKADMFQLVAPLTLIEPAP